MADIFKSAAPEYGAKAGTFQDFDVVFPIVEYMFENRRINLRVISAPEWKSKQQAPAPTGSPLAQLIAADDLYFFDLATGAVPTSVLTAWKEKCRAIEEVFVFRGPPPLLNLSPEDFKGEKFIAPLNIPIPPVPLLEPVNVQ